MFEKLTKLQSSFFQVKRAPLWEAIVLENLRVNGQQSSREKKVVLGVMFCPFPFVHQLGKWVDHGQVVSKFLQIRNKIRLKNTLLLKTELWSGLKNTCKARCIMWSSNKSYRHRCSSLSSPFCSGNVSTIYFHSVLVAVVWYVFTKRRWYIRHCHEANEVFLNFCFRVWIVAVSRKEEEWQIPHPHETWICCCCHVKSK